jgi:beta-phosphoglucomutase
VRSALHYAAERVPVGIVSGAIREGIEPVLSAADLRGVIGFIVSADDVATGKPEATFAPSRCWRRRVRREVLCVEDTEAGTASAKAAGLRVVVLTRTLRPERLRRADVLIHAICPALSGICSPELRPYALKPTDRRP